MAPQSRSLSSVPTDPTRTELTTEALARSIADHLRFTLGITPESASRNDWYLAVAYAVRDRLVQRWMASSDTVCRREVRVVAYLSAEFLIGPQLGSNLINLGIVAETSAAVGRFGLDLGEILEQEQEPGLGNGGLGRLAACFLDSLSTLEVPALGYGIRYEFGIFDQEIRDGWQVEVADKWLRYGYPWEIRRPELAQDVRFGGRTESFTTPGGATGVRWVPARVVRGVPHDTPIAGFGVKTANALRLWQAEASESFDLAAFQSGDYFQAVHEKVASETITKVLYPNDAKPQGKQLRLEQQYFFTSCALQDMLRMHREARSRMDAFHESWAVQMNDTHPAIAVAELMRLLVDENGLPWERAWDVTRGTLSYTNHTLLPEALETWPLPLFREVLPRHLEIVFEINRRFLDEVRIAGGDDDVVRRNSLIDEDGDKAIRMAHLAVVGSHAVNGVSELHSELLRRELLPDFHKMYPERFRNVTNGVTPRRFLVLANPRLAALISRRIGDRWILHTSEELHRLEALSEDEGFRSEWRQVRAANKRDFCDELRARTGVVADPDSLFDVQVKRFHEYKRQHLNVLHIVALYNRLKADPGLDLTPRTFVFGGKAAPGYDLAKRMIRLIHGVAEVVNGDAAVAGRLKVAFYPDFNVRAGQRIYPVADLSEQISTAGKEASGTGNMKFGFNGAITIGTLDGANVEIRDAVGAENFALFGLTIEDLKALRGRGYRPREFADGHPELREALGQIAGGVFSRGDRAMFAPLVASLLERDQYFVLADFPSYVETQARAGQAFRDTSHWTRMSILNTARMGRFSSDRAVREYCEGIWKIGPVRVELQDEDLLPD